MLTGDRFICILPMTNTYEQAKEKSYANTDSVLLHHNEPHLRNQHVSIRLSNEFST